MTKIFQLIDTLESKVPQKDKLAATISDTTIGWQISHSLKVINGVVKLVSKSNSSEYKWEFNFARLIVFSLGFIPRKSGRAPKEVVPKKEELTNEELAILFEKVRTRLKPFMKSDANAHFRHLYFGTLNLKQSIRFLEIHTHHHLKIIQDIEKKG